MKYFFIAMLLFLGVNCFGQVKTYTNVDKFTGDTTIETDEYPIEVNHINKKDSFVSYSATAYLYKIKGKKLYSLAITFDAYDVMSIDGGLAYFKTVSGETIQASRTGGYKVYAKDDHVFYALDITGVIEKLKDSEVTAIRLTTNNGDRDIDLKNHTFVISQLITTLQP